MTIKYIAGYKYQLYETYKHKLDGNWAEVDNHEFIAIKNNVLYISKGYAWDGASGANDTPDIMRSSLVHDAMYQLMRAGLIPESRKDYADKLLHDICVQDGMSHFRANYIYEAVHLCGEQYAKRQDPQIITAP